MKYITGYHSLNQTCTTGTTGDWHPASVDWDNPHVLDSNNSPLAEEGIVWKASRYKGYLLEPTWIATHARALADLIFEYVNTDIRKIRFLKGSVGDWIDNKEQIEVLKSMISIIYKSNPDLWQSDETRRFIVCEFSREFLIELESGNL